MPFIMTYSKNSTYAFNYNSLKHVKAEAERLLQQDDPLSKETLVCLQQYYKSGNNDQFYIFGGKFNLDLVTEVLQKITQILEDHDQNK